jgi:phosphoglycolate phosphatase
MIRVAVFDFDGTLVDSNAIKDRSFGDVVARLPGGPDALATARLGGGDRHRIFGEVSRRLEPDAAAQLILARRLANDYGRRCLKAIGAAPERRGAGRALRHLRQRGIRLYLNTATPQADIPALLRARRWAGLFCGVYGAPRGKVDILRAILRREHIAPRAMLMVGDSRDDLESAREVGTWFIGITAESRIALRAPFGMRDLQKLPALVDRLGRRFPK